jgi:hypothetical protein
MLATIGVDGRNVAAGVGRKASVGSMPYCRSCSA